MPRQMMLLVLTTVPAPYRVAVFNLLGQEVDLDVLFEHPDESTRVATWFTYDFDTFSGSILYSRNHINITRLFGIAKKLLLRHYDAVLVYEYSTLTAQILIRLLRFLRIPYIINCDGALPAVDSQLKSAIKSSSIRRATACFASGTMAAEYFLRYGAAPSTIFYHPFTSLSTNEIRSSVPSNIDKTLLRNSLNIGARSVAITASRLIRSKRIDALVRAWSRLPDDHLLLIAGSGPEEDTYRELVASLSLHNVRFLGHIERDVLFDYFDASDLFVLPTETDTWGLVVNEAMARGLPVISTNQCVAGIELVRPGYNGFLVEVDDEDGLVTAITRIFSDTSARLRMAANSLAEIAPYTYENLAKAHLKALTTILHQ